MTQWTRRTAVKMCKVMSQSKRNEQQTPEIALTFKINVQDTKATEFQD